MTLFYITNILFWVTFIIGIIFFVIYGLEWIHFFNSRKNINSLNNYTPKKTRNFALIIPARNESVTLSKLINSMQEQKYDGKIDIYLVADNCTDNRMTYNIGISKGVTVLERFNDIQKGGNFAIQHALRYIRDNNLLDNYDCFCSFDADNLLDKNWVFEVNKAFDFYGSEVVTTYRNSKNYADNWISSAYSIQFIKESSVINKSRNYKRYSAYVNGTGFSFTKKILEQTNWWDFNSLSHDIEFTQWLLLNNVNCAYSENAIFYDEQPIRFKDSWKQRMRWCVGFKQVWNIYKNRLNTALVKKNINKPSLITNYIMISPAIYTLIINISFYLITSISMVLMYFINYTLDPVTYVDYNLFGLILYILLTPFVIIITIYLNLFVQAIIIVKRNWKRINAKKSKKIISIFTYPLFMLSYIPISFIALFKKTYSTTPIQRKENQD
ncbi:glycosyltransferase family 2 protein [Mycoplasma crocodyli]|uniref:Hypothetical biofilm synthesis N-glycosyltransferase n=1 Tax=Mycoplasma crocodyli (strain ATCC 51981 / MP145) TaxID=512564 RepID=D5E5Z7_MYCCM|nr:glycosyltransferase family 2 protein [Mycoplasma crocodyli]ADE19752.1 hypothetical biofilm synthesis N-glycosyltransferase [Mycoplasma crocodyli MP145]